LRKDQYAVGADRKCGVEGKAVVLTRFGNHVGARMTLKVVVVALPIAVETELPGPLGRKADNVAILGLVEKIGDDHHVVRRSALVPAVKGDDLAFVMHVIDLGELPAEAARKTTAVEPQPDEVVVQPNDAVELVPLIPINGDRVAEPPAFEKLLPLEEHGNAGSRKDHGGCQCRTFPCVPPLGVVRADLLRHTFLAVRHLVVGFAVDDPVEAVIVVTVTDGVADGAEGALLVLGSDHRLTDRVDKVGIPLGAEPGPPGPDVLGEPFIVLQVLGDRDPAGVFPGDLVVDPLEQAPAFGQVMAIGAIEGADELGAVESGCRRCGILRAT
jgi:hypothetical protein